MRTLISDNNRRIILLLRAPRMYLARVIQIIGQIAVGTGADANGTPVLVT